MAQTKVPRYYELEAFRRSVNRKLWFGMTSLCLTAMASLFLALVAFTRPVPVVAFDGKGQPVLFEDTVSPRQTLTDMRIEYFTKEFIRHYAGVDSVNVTEDLARALNMMTPVYRKLVATNQEELAKRNQYKGQNIRTAFTDWKIRIGKYDPEELGGVVYLLVSGRMTFEPRFGTLTGQGDVNRWFVASLKLQRVPVSKMSIHGLLVDWVDLKYFDDRERMEAHVVARGKRA